MEYKINLEAIKEVAKSNGAGFITSSGLHEIVVKDVYIETTKNGATQAGIVYSLPTALDKQSRLFMYLTNKDGKDSFSKPIFDSLLFLLGVKEVKLAKKTLNFKEPVEKDCVVGVSDKPIIVWTRQHFRKWNGEIREQFDVMDFFGSRTKATAREAITNGEAGKRYNSLAQTSKAVKYEGCTETEVDNWMKARMSGKKVVEQPKVEEDDELMF